MIAIIVSVITYIHSWKVEENVRETELRKEIKANNEAMKLESNLDFFSLCIDNIIFSLQSEVSQKESEELWEIQKNISKKEYIVPLNKLIEVKNEHEDCAEILLLEALLRARDYIVRNEYIFDEDKEIISSIIDSAIAKGIDLDEYGIIVGIVEYYLRDFISSLQYIEHEKKQYYSDSVYYDVANYWLARLSVETRVIYCEIDDFLQSDYESTLYTQFLKTSISRMIKDDVMLVRKFGSYSSTFRYIIQPVFDDSDYISEEYFKDKIPYSTNLYYSINVKHIVDLKRYIQYNWAIMEDVFIEAINEEKKQMYSEYQQKRPGDFDFLGGGIDNILQVPNNEESAMHCLDYEITNIGVIFSRYYMMCFSSPILLDFYVEDYVYQTILLYSIWSRGELEEYVSLYYAIVLGWLEKFICEESDYERATYAVAFLNYYQYIDEIDSAKWKDTFDVDIYQMALEAYEEGYRLQVVYRYLLDYFSGNIEMTERLKEEMEILRLEETKECKRLEEFY